jgi:transmembrane sensor
MPDGPDSELLGRYLTGECSEAETASVRRYLMARPDAAKSLEQYLEQLDGGVLRQPAPDSAASWDVLRRRLREADQTAGRDANAPCGSALAPHPPAVVPSGRRSTFALLPLTPRVAWWRRRGTATAVCSVAAVAALATYEAGRPRRVAAPVASPRTYATAARQRADLELSDGTRVRIAPASHLRVAADFGSERRDVYLEGEAYFDVVHDEERPFTVYAGNASAHDLGTGFSVRSYAEEGAVQVVVREGAVALSGVGRLAAGDVGRLTTEGRASVRRQVDVGALLGWLDGRLAYEDAPLGQVLQDLRRWYGVDARLADSALATLPFTGTLAGLRSAAAIDLVAATLGLRARHAGGRVLLHAIAGQTPRDRQRRTFIVP